MKILKVSLVATITITAGIAVISSKPASGIISSPDFKVEQQVSWRYQGEDEDDILNANAWSRTLPEVTGCGDGEELPCTIMGPNDPSQFQVHLTSLGTNGVLDESPNKRDIEQK